MNCIVIDDDKTTQALLNQFINKNSLLNCLGTFNNPIETKETLGNNIGGF